MAQVVASQNYDYLRRNKSEKQATSMRRKPLRQDSTRGSNGTVSSRMTVSTQVTEPPAYNKKFVVVYVHSSFSLSRSENVEIAKRLRKRENPFAVATAVAGRRVYSSAIAKATSQR